MSWFMFHADQDDYVEQLEKMAKRALYAMPLAYSANITVDLAQDFRAVYFTLTGNANLLVTGGDESQHLRPFFVLATQGAGGNKILTLSTGIGFTADLPSYTGSTTAGKVDTLGFLYWHPPGSPTGKAIFEGVNRGFVFP